MKQPDFLGPAAGWKPRSDSGRREHCIIMHITLISPPFIFPDTYSVVPSHCLGIRYISAYLRTHGIRTHVVDALQQGLQQVRPYGGTGCLAGLDQEAILAAIPQETDLLALSVPFSQLAPIAHELAAALKQRFPDKLLVMGGVYPSTQPEQALRSTADCIVVGEGEDALRQLADGVLPTSIRGVYRIPPEDGRFQPALPIEDLDRLPFPDLELPAIQSYFRRSSRNHRQVLTASLITSRGCPYSCEFCSIHPVYGRGWRGRSAGNVLEEIRLLADRFGVEHFEIEDDNFTLDRQRTIAILEGIRELQAAGRRIGWSTPNGIRIDTLDDEVIRLMVASGCSEIVLALEHGDPEMLALMDKRLDLGRVFQVLEQLVRHDMPSIILFVIVGYPGETVQRFENSLATLRKIRRLVGRRVQACVNIAQPYPGTRLLENCRANGWLVDPAAHDFLNSRQVMATTHTVHIVTPDFDQAEVLHRVRRIEAIFEGRIRHLLKGSASLRQLVRCIKSRLAR